MVARLGASMGLVIIPLAGVVLAGGSVAALLLVTVDDPPATEQAATESADVELIRCGRSLQRMSAGVRVTNASTGTSDYFIDLEFVRRSGEVVEVAQVVIEDVEAGATRRKAVVSTRQAPGRFECRIGDVDRLSA
jgi:hypothetical protein